MDQMAQMAPGRHCRRMNLCASNASGDTRGSHEHAEHLCKPESRQLCLCCCPDLSKRCRIRLSVLHMGGHWQHLRWGGDRAGATAGGRAGDVTGCGFKCSDDAEDGIDVGGGSRGFSDVAA